MSKEDIPNYRPATGSKKCGNCGAFQARRMCEMFDAEVKPYYTCDDWVTEEEWHNQKTEEIYKEVSHYIEEKEEEKEKLSSARKELFELGAMLEGKKGVHHFLQLEQDFEDGRLPPGTHLTPKSEKSDVFQQADMPLSVYIRKPPQDIPAPSKEINLSDDGDQELYLMSYPEKDVYLFRGDSSTFSEYFRKTSRKEDRIHWTLGAVQTGAILGLYFDAETRFDQLKAALDDKDQDNLQMLYNTCKSELLDALNQSTDWSYGRVEIKRKLDRGYVPLSDLYLLLKHASSVGKLVKNQVNIDGDLGVVHNSIGDYLEAADLNPQIKSPISVDFVITNMSSEELVESVKNKEIDYKSGVCYVEELPDRQFVNVSYVEGDVEDSLRHTMKSVRNLNEYGYEILSKAMNAKGAPSLPREGEKILKEGYWGAVKKGGEFFESLPEEFFQAVSHLDKKVLSFKHQVLSNLSDFREFDESEIAVIANRAQAGNDEQLEELESTLNSAIGKLHELPETITVKGVENAGLDRTKVDKDHVYQLANMSAFTSQLAKSLHQSNPQEIKDEMDGLKRQVFYYETQMPIYELKASGEASLFQDGKVQKVQPEDEGDEGFEAAEVKIFPTESGNVVLEFKILDGVDEETGEFSYSKYKFNGERFKEV